MNSSSSTNVNSHKEIAMLRRANFMINRQEISEWRIHLYSSPISVMLPTGNKCNLKCIMCINRDHETGLWDFTLESFLKIVPDIRSTTSLAIYGWGEPLINPHYEVIYDHICHSFPGVILHVSTNGTLINQYWQTKFTSTSNLFLNVSLNAASRSTYEAVTGVDCFDEVVNNISMLKSLKRERRSRFPVITISFVMLDINIHELPELIVMGRDLEVDDIIVSDLMCLRQEHAKLQIKDHSQARLFYERANQISDAYGGFPPLTLFTDVPYLPTRYDNLCTDPWESLKIAENGDASICCYANTSFGNIYHQSIGSIWNSEQVKEYRRLVNTKNPPGPCRSCPKKRQLFNMSKGTGDLEAGIHPINRRI